MTARGSARRTLTGCEASAGSGAVDGGVGVTTGASRATGRRRVNRRCRRGLRQRRGRWRAPPQQQGADASCDQDQGRGHRGNPHGTPHADPRCHAPAVRAGPPRAWPSPTFAPPAALSSVTAAGSCLKSSAICCARRHEGHSTRCARNANVSVLVSARRRPRPAARSAVVSPHFDAAFPCSASLTPSISASCRSR